MGNPPGTQNNRWNQAVNAVASELGWTNAEADAWLNGVWTNMYVDEAFGNEEAHERLRLWLDANDNVSPTLPLAFKRFVT